MTAEWVQEPRAGVYPLSPSGLLAAAIEGIIPESIDASFTVKILPLDRLCLTAAIIGTSDSLVSTKVACIFSFSYSDVNTPSSLS